MDYMKKCILTLLFTAYFLLILQGSAVYNDLKRAMNAVKSPYFMRIQESLKFYY